MKITVDADACPVKKEIVKVAKDLGIPVIMFFDNTHIYSDDYCEVVILDKARDSVDIALVNKANKGDIVISQDYGVAAMALARECYVLDFNGGAYTKDTIDELLFKRHLSAKVRRAGGKTGGPKKRNKENNIDFEASLKRLCISLKNN